MRSILKFIIFVGPFSNKLILCFKQDLSGGQTMNAEQKSYMKDLKLLIQTMLKLNTLLTPLSVQCSFVYLSRLIYRSLLKSRTILTDKKLPYMAYKQITRLLVLNKLIILNKRYCITKKLESMTPRYKKRKMTR